MSAVKTLLRDPFVQFMLLGALVFALFNTFGEDTAGNTVVVSDSDVARLTAQWQSQYSRPPSPEQTAAIVKQYVQEEILYREARKLDLGEDDVIIRRRMVQKYRFLSEEMLDIPTPSAAILEDFYRQTKSRYITPSKTSFYHVYFRDDASQSAQLQQQAQALAAELNEQPADSTTWRSSGDAFMLQRQYAARTELDIGQLFGRGFASALANMAPGQWSAPVRSAFGWHAVKVVNKTPQYQQSLAKVESQVLEHYNVEQRRLASEAFYRDTKSQYHIVYANPAMAVQRDSESAK